MHKQWSLFVSLFVIIGLCSFLKAKEQNCDSVKCNYDKHYVELGCKPIIKPGECCAERFDCGNVMKSDRSKCYFKGKSYANATRLPTTETGCLGDCYCYMGAFSCAQAECPEEVFNRPPPECVIVSSFDKCCASEIICDQRKVEKLPTCVLDGRTYTKGQKMYPQSGLCHHCICDENFDNSTAIEKNPSCKPIDCSIELFYFNAIRDGCVPIYWRSSKCCPIGTKCPTPADKKIPSESGKPGSKEIFCKFGKLSLQIGDKVTDSDKCTQCECVLPPMITCIKTDCEK